MHYIDELKKQGANWVRKQDFWLFGTATFKDGKPYKWTKTYHDDKTESYSFFKNGIKTLTHTNLEYVVDKEFGDDKLGPG